MIYIVYLLITLLTFIIMEGITWCTHKYVMHGFGWYLHEYHHRPGYKHVFEKNDAFFIIFATPSILLFVYGIMPELNYLFFIGLGIFLYGLAYFLIHDVLIHRRFKWFDKVNNRYFRAARKAHKIHHKRMGKPDGQCFGMLFFPFKFYKEAR